jgi:hypothetical protein
MGSPFDAASPVEAAATYAKFGVAVLRGFFSPGALAGVRAAASDMLAALGPQLALYAAEGAKNPRLQLDTGPDGATTVRMVEPFVDLSAAMQECVHRPLVALAASLLGEEAALFEDKVVAKHARGSELSGFDWHQVSFVHALRTYYGSGTIDGRCAGAGLSILEAILARAALNLRRGR